MGDTYVMGGIPRHPVIEIYGPTIQGEGAQLGLPTMFVRFGGCDYRCSWCDTMFAVLPDEVRKNSTRMSDDEIVSELVRDRRTDWVTFSGGNPLLLKLDSLVDLLHSYGFKINVETQGSVYRDWARKCDLITVSPKPPSSGMRPDLKVLDKFMELSNVVLKVVVLDELDFEFARYLHNRYKHVPFYLQPCNDSPGSPDIESLVRRLDWLVSKTLECRDMSDARVLPQLHVLIWGNERRR